MPESLRIPTERRYAYAASLWGANPGFALGALVLGRALRRSGVTHDLVLLHTADVPKSTCTLLSRVWRLKLVDYIDANAGLFRMKGGRFDGVFTKLHVLNLVEYEKVLMLDLDLAILKCPDVLFELQAPAAMHRSVGGMAHGARIDGRNFFAGASVDSWSEVEPWSQCSGINAGVMVLEPGAEIYARALQEVTLASHPERIAGSGPEQDYISRLYAPWWTHISVCWNFQLHRVFHALERMLKDLAEEREMKQEGEGETVQAWVPERILVDVDELCIIHCSGELKLWDVDFLSGRSDEECASDILRGCAEWYLRAWQDKQCYPDEYAEYGVELSQDGEFRMIGSGESCHKVVESALTRANEAARRAARQFREDLASLCEASDELPPPPELLEQLRNPSWPKDAAFPRGAKVEVWHGRTRAWYTGTVEGADEVEGTFCVAFDEPGSWGSGARGLTPDYIRWPR